MFAAVLAGSRPAYLSKVDEVDVYDAKGIAVELVERLSGRRVTVEHAREGLPHLHPRGAAHIKVDGATVGSLGPLHPNVADALDLDGIAQVIELDLGALETMGARTPRYRPIPRLPAIARDVALVVGEEVLAGDIEGVIAKAAGDLCESVELFDVFTGETISAGRRSLALRVVYRDTKASNDPESARTLTDREVDERHERVRAALREIGELRA
jgi:phenylalanyl-tRNA synthetase beta chain